MADQAHPHWGRVKDAYDRTYVYHESEASQKATLSPRVLDALRDDGTEAITKLCDLGESSLDPNWDDYANHITLPMLHSVMQYMVCKCSLPKLGNPLVIRGCIKLMRSITRFGRPSPFSYEYGHLCFQILVVAFDYCVLQLSDHYEFWITQIEHPEYESLKAGHVPMLSEDVSFLLADSMDEGADPQYHNISKKILS